MIPVVDFEKCSILIADGKLTETDKQSVAAQICDAFKTVGFVYLKNSGISGEYVSQVNAVSRKFFALSQEVKSRCARGISDSNFGYDGLEAEQLSSERPGDLKESFNLTPEQEQEKKWPNQELPEFKKIMWEMYETCSKLSLRILELMATGLNLSDKKLFVEAHSAIMTGKSLNTLRTLYYPPLSNDADVKENQIRCGEHSDYGSITLLFQDQVGGLEVMNRQQEFVAATPIPDTVLVNVGDLMQRWTSDVLQSTIHRVLIPESEVKRHEARQSLAFFVHPDDHELITCIDGSNKYEPINSLDYLNMRFAATY